MNSFFTLHSFLEVGKTQDLPTKFWQTLGDARSPSQIFGLRWFVIIDVVMESLIILPIQ
jgi:hypothetical protein